MLETTIIGNVGSLRLAQAGETQVLNISIATSRKIGEREFTDWVAAKIWGERASKLAPYIHKGAKLLLRGRPMAKGFQRTDGTVSGELVLHVHELQFLTAKPKPPQADQLPLEVPPTAKSRKRKSEAG